MALSLRSGVAAVVAIAAVACSEPEPPRPQPAPDSLRVLTQGEIVGFERAGAHVWRGLPFAAPPVGPLRWRAPRPPAPWEGRREALRFGAACMQFAPPVAAPPEATAGEPTGSEDCLTLNVFAPAFAPAGVPQGEARLPVLFWIHGGGNSIGSAHTYDASRLAASRGVVVVTTQYRLGVLGWFYHPSLAAAGASAEDASGNYGTLDLIRALGWVREHVGAFGGDPDNVTIFGESAGGRNVFSLLVAPAAKGLFHRAIVQSGSTRSSSRAHAAHWADSAEPGHPRSSNEVIAELLVAAGGAADAPAARARVDSEEPAELATELRAIPAEDLLAPFEGQGFFGMYDAPELIRDGVVLPAREIPAALRAGDYHRVPIMLGATRDEVKLFLPFRSPDIGRVFGIPLWIRDAASYELHAEYESALRRAVGADDPAAVMRAIQGASVYAYRFDWDELPKLLWLDLSELLGAAHGLELPFVFGQLDFGRATRFVFSEESRPAAERLARQMTSYWTQFATTGDPGRGRAGDLPLWTAWDASAPDAPKMMLLDSATDGGLRMSPRVVTREGLLASAAVDPRFKDDADRCALFQNLVPRRMSAGEYAALAACRAHPLDAVSR